MAFSVEKSFGMPFNLNSGAFNREACVRCWYLETRSLALPKAGERLALVAWFFLSMTRSGDNPG